MRGEFEKLADNVSIWKNLAAAHYFSNQWKSLLLVEKAAIGISEETKLVQGNLPRVLPKWSL